MEAPLPRCATITRPFGNARCNFIQTCGDVFIRKPVKSVPPDAFAIELFGYCIMIDNSTVRTMKCRIEAGDLNQPGSELAKQSGSAPDCWVGETVRAQQTAPSAQARFRRSKPAGHSQDRHERRDDRRDKLYVLGLAQPFARRRGRRRHIDMSPGAYDFSTSGDPSDASARRRGRAPIPSTCPFNRRRGSSPCRSSKI